MTQKSPSAHHPTPLSGYIFVSKAHVDNRKETCETAICSPHVLTMVIFGPLAAEICWRVWGTPTNFNGFCVLAALLHGI